MITATLDTNIFISGMLGLHRPNSIPGEIVRKWRSGAFLSVTSVPLFDEVMTTLAEPYFLARIVKDDRDLAIEALLKDARHVHPLGSVTGMATHPEDDLVIETAITGSVDFLVTGHKQLLRLDGTMGLRS